MALKNAIQQHREQGLWPELSESEKSIGGYNWQPKSPIEQDLVQEMDLFGEGGRSTRSLFRPIGLFSAFFTHSLNSSTFWLMAHQDSTSVHRFIVDGFEKASQQHIRSICNPKNLQR